MPRRLSTPQSFVLLFCCYGFLVEFKPSEPYLTPFLNIDKNFSLTSLNDDVYPYWTYSYFVAAGLVVFFAVPPILKWLVLLGSLCRFLTRIQLVWGSQLWTMQLMQVTFGIASAAEIFYYSYVYLFIPREMYVFATGALRASTLFGHVTSALLAQALVSWTNASLFSLFYISMATVGLGTILSVFFPTLKHAIGAWEGNSSTAKDGINHADARQSEVDSVVHGKRIPCSSVRSHLISLGYFLQCAFRSREAVLLCVWWWIAVASDNLVLNYANPLFSAIDRNTKLNGLVAALARLGGVLGALVPPTVTAVRQRKKIPTSTEDSAERLLNGNAENGKGKIRELSPSGEPSFWSTRSSFIFVAGCCGACGTCLFIMAAAKDLASAYTLYAIDQLFMTTAMTTMTICIARGVGDQAVGAVMALNVLILTALQTVVQILMGRHVAQLTIFSQFYLFGALYIVCAIFAVFASVSLPSGSSRSKFSRRRQQITFGEVIETEVVDMVTGGGREGPNL